MPIAAYESAFAQTGFANFAVHRPEVSITPPMAIPTFGTIS